METWPLCSVVVFLFVFGFGFFVFCCCCFGLLGWFCCSCCCLVWFVFLIKENANIFKRLLPLAGGESKAQTWACTCLQLWQKLSLHCQPLPLPPASDFATMPCHSLCGTCVLFTVLFCLLKYITPKTFAGLAIYLLFLCIVLPLLKLRFFKLSQNSWLLATPVTYQTIFSSQSSSLLTLLKCFREVLFTQSSPALHLITRLPQSKRELGYWSGKQPIHLCSAGWVQEQVFLTAFLPSKPTDTSPSTCPQSADNLWPGLLNT